MILCFRKLDPNYNPSQKTTKPQQTDALLTNVNKKTVKFAFIQLNHGTPLDVKPAAAQQPCSSPKKHWS